ncbi:unnamed protein product [Urochloa humidicola]
MGGLGHAVLASSSCSCYIARDPELLMRLTIAICWTPASKPRCMPASQWLVSRPQAANKDGLGCIVLIPPTCNLSGDNRIYILYVLCSGDLNLYLPILSGCNETTLGIGNGRERPDQWSRSYSRKEGTDGSGCRLLVTRDCWLQACKARKGI